MKSASANILTSREAAFIVTKPLQLMVAMSLVEQLKLEAVATFFVVDSFANAEQIAKALEKLTTRLKSVVFCKDHRQAYRAASARNFYAIYIDSDVGLRRYVDLIRLKINSPSRVIAVYEEGIGTYRNDLYAGARKLILSLFGAGVNFGGCRLTTRVYVYEPGEYRERVSRRVKDVQRVLCPLNDFILANESLFDFLFGKDDVLPSVADNRRDSECHVYLSNWTLDNEVIDHVRHRPGQKYIKAHPHISRIDKIQGFEIIPSHVPGELMLIRMLRCYERINVYHHGSSLERYINNDRVRFILAK